MVMDADWNCVLRAQLHSSAIGVVATAKIAATVHKSYLGRLPRCLVS